LGKIVLMLAASALPRRAELDVRGHHQHPELELPHNVGRHVEVQLLDRVSEPSHLAAELCSQLERVLRGAGAGLRLIQPAQAPLQLGSKRGQEPAEDLMPGLADVRDQAQLWKAVRDQAPGCQPHQEIRFGSGKGGLEQSLDRVRCCRAVATPIAAPSTSTAAGWSPVLDRGTGRPGTQRVPREVDLAPWLPSEAQGTHHMEVPLSSRTPCLDPPVDPETGMSQERGPGHLEAARADVTYLEQGLCAGNDTEATRRHYPGSHEPMLHSPPRRAHRLTTSHLMDRPADRLEQRYRRGRRVAGPDPLPGSEDLRSHGGMHVELWDGQMNLFDENPQREVPVDRRVVVFDLETQRSFDEVGRSGTAQLLVSVAVAYRYDTDELLVYTEENISELIELLCAAELVVGYNIKGFDYEVLRAYTDKDLQQLPTMDLMYDLEDRLGFRPKLDSVASATLGVGKSADGLKALEWWKQGEIDKIIEYCSDDVRVTRDLYSFGIRNRCVLVSRLGGKPRKVEVDWKS